MMSNPWGFVAGEGHRWYTDPNKCPHYNENVCEGCDFDGYYAANYATCPWRTKAADVNLLEELDRMGPDVLDEDERRGF